MLLGAVVLTAAAWLRGAEYDEQYTLFLTAGTARPDWPQTAFPAGLVAAVQAGHATFGGIALDLRATDVHPPLYFWAVALWRQAFGPTLLAARMLSVLCGVMSLGLAGEIARRCSVRPALAMLLTLGCYGFVYTNAIARGFALAEVLTLGGVALLMRRQGLLAGICFGAAGCCNYLAVFVAAAGTLVIGAWSSALAALPFLALDGWFFVAQHGARAGQFPPFKVWPSLRRLADYQSAAVFGGLPLYADGFWRVAIMGGVALLSAALAVRIAAGLSSLGLRQNDRDVRRTPPDAHRLDGIGSRCQRRRNDLTTVRERALGIRTIAAAAVATPAGLLLLGVMFDNTPIELRYLSFGLPFVCLLAAAFAGRLLPVVLVIQSASIAGLLLAPQTMQPARAAAAGAARLAGDGIVVLPWGNDGVGIVGAFGIEAPGSLPILVVRPADPILDRVAAYRRVVLVLLGQDPDSVATVAAMRAAFTNPNWRLIAIGSNLEVYEKRE